MADFNPQKEEHDQLRKDIIEVIENKDELVPTPDLKEEIAWEKHWGENYFRYKLLPEALRYMRDESKEIHIAETRREGGNPTHYYEVTQK